MAYYEPYERYVDPYYSRRGQRHSFGDSYYSGTPYYGDYRRDKEPKDFGEKIKSSIGKLFEPDQGNPSGKKNYKKAGFIKKVGKVAKDCALDPYCRKGVLSAGTHIVKAIGSYVGKKDMSISTQKPNQVESNVQPIDQGWQKVKKPKAPKSVRPSLPTFVGPAIRKRRQNWRVDTVMGERPRSTRRFRQGQV